MKAEPLKIVASLLCLFAATASAGSVDAIWEPAPQDTSWNNGKNWVGQNDPSAPGDTATFNTSTRTSLILTEKTAIDTITFSPGANAFTIQTNGEHLYLDLAGIVNNSSAMQTISNNAAGSGFILYGGASGGNAALVNSDPTAYFDISQVSGAGASIGSIAGNGTIYLGGKNLAVGGNNTSTVFSGVIADGGTPNEELSDFEDFSTGGSLTKVGSGALILTGANTYTGNTTVNGGSLFVDGSIASPTTFVNSGGLLGGVGLIGGNLVNSGIVSPGDAPGTLSVGGGYTQYSGGALVIKVAGLATGEHDLLAVRGSAALAGALKIVPVNGFKFGAGNEFTFLTAGRGVSGTFGTFTDDFNTGTVLKGHLIYSPNSVAFEETQGSFGEFASEVCKTPNHVAVGKALDSAVGNPSASNLISFLDSEPTSRLCGDLGLLEPEELASIFNLGVSLANVQTANLERRMEDIQAGSNGFSSAGFSMNGSSSGFSAGLAGPTGPEGKSGKSVMQPAPDNRWGAFVTGLGEFTNVSSTGNASGYDLTTGGVTLGVDYSVCPHFAVGVTAGYAHTDASLGNGGDIDVDGGKFGIYATGFDKGLYVDAAVTGGFSDYDTHRTALLGTASGRTDGGELNTLLATGYDWKKGGLSIGPTASFQYTYVGIDSFTEHGSLAPLAFNGQQADSLRTSVGMKASYNWKVGKVLVIPEVSTGWQHEFGDTDYALVSRFASGAGKNNFTVHGPSIGRDSLLIGAGFAVQWNDRVSTYAYYDGEVATTNYQSNNVSAGFRISF